MNSNKWKNQYIAKLEDIPDIIVSLKDNTVTENAKKFVTEKASNFDGIICEFGSGSGMHLVELAKQNPSSLCIGFEVRYKRAYKTAEKAKLNKLENLLVVRGKAEEVKYFFSENSIQGFYINFPDPWAKKRWLKHRLVSKTNIKLWTKLLENSGFISFKTDHKNYFYSVKEYFTSDILDITAESNNLLESKYAMANIPTEFENLFRYQGLPIYYIKTVKK